MAASAVGKVAYATLFVVLLPLFLGSWSRVVVTPFPPLQCPIAGGVLAVLGLVVLVLGIFTLWRIGGGPPMNVCPPPRLVTSGIYSMLPHPIYSGFVLACLGVSLATGSATGLWITTPLVALACLALVIGHERPYLLRTHNALPRPWLRFERVGGPIVALFRLDRTWAGLLGWTERLANSWTEWRFGPLRVINHGIYGGIAGGVAAVVVTLLSGVSALPSVIVVLTFGLVGAAVWAQILEGSSILSRPFGYYGSVLGVALGGVLLWISGEPVLLPLAALSLAAPWVQAVGRVRCLIQGCCHGKPTTARHGIRVNNPHSRVCAIASLAGKAVHPTQLYSIISNILIGPLLAGLWLSAAQLTMVIGAYLALAGIARFTEEGYRGEPQTQRIAGLSIYQWLSIASLAAGMWTMTVRSPSAGTMLLSPVRVAVATGVAYSLVCWFALGMDFPTSRRRFSRLSG